MLLSEHKLEFLCFTGGCTGSSESTHVKMPHFWKSHVPAHTIWPLTRENLSSVFANNKGADQPAHPRRLISAFVVRFLKSIISKLASREISIF